MANLTLRSTTSATDPGSTSAKGSALTHTEMDSNFILLQADIDGKISAASPTLTGATTIDDELRFNDSDDSNYITVKAPATVGTNYTLTLPTTDGNANEVLITDGSGNLSWSATYAGDITEVTAGNGLSGGGASGSVSLAFDITDTNITKDEDDMVSDSASHLATQQSIKAYVDATVAATNEVVEDTTPQLGGDLDVNGQSIVTTSNGDIVLAPNGTGEVDITSNIKQSGANEIEQYGGDTGLFIHDQSEGGYTTQDFSRPGGMLAGPGIQIDSAGQYQYPSLVLRNNSIDGYPYIWAAKARPSGGTDYTTDAYMENDEILFRYYGAPYNGAASAGQEYFTAGALCDFRASETHSSGNLGCKIEFSTINTGSTTDTIKMTIGNQVTMNSLLELKAYASTSLPTGVNGAIISISDSPTNSYRPAYYDGSNWRYIHDNNTV